MRAVVRQARNVFDLSERVAVRLQCGGCRDDVVQPLDRTPTSLRPLVPRARPSGAVPRNARTLHDPHVAGTEASACRAAV